MERVRLVLPLVEMRGVEGSDLGRFRNSVSVSP